ncbi:immune inhibitor A domain-containing protein [Halobacillus naozhouensis]|uniref:Immune inhibitor A n=1 Tax=Halobacillus naozhouensis TaxID=554880 RepID=A0ABY8IZ19_9BACI|nr:immune inhibitor A domain-containing protein [Halobacillus naozhouensis]WFT73866.1 immune inhibitor A [Halobacillus naozhouensis]
MKKNSKIVTSALALTLALAPFSSSVLADSGTVQSDVHKAHAHEKGGAPFDLAIANDERLIEMLKESGKISKNATPEEAKRALNKYLDAKSEAAANKAKKEDKGKMDKEKAENRAKLTDNAKNNSMTNGKGNKLGQAKKNRVTTVDEEAWNGETRTDNVLVLLIEYPNKPHNSMSASETDMYYEGENAYSKEHYEDMLFGDGGWVGPDGKTYVSMKQYYEKQSGGSYSVEGTVAGWYEADHPAAYYGANDPAPDGSDINARGLVKEALNAAANDSDVNLSNFDEWDRYDLDGDGNYMESDGLVDHLMVIHSGVGEEAGGGSLGSDAIWSHRWNLAQPTAIKGTEATVDYWGGQMAAFDYTIEPEDGAVGVMAHEFGHDLGLPDEYDTQYSGAGEPVAYWSIMASGSWAGDIPGTMPTGFSPYAKEMLQGTAGGNWLTGTEISVDDVSQQPVEVLIDEAVTKGTNNDAVKVTLPDKKTVINEPVSGQYEYFSGSDNSLTNTMTKTVDLTNASSAELTFQAWYDIETNWDYAYVTVNGEPIEGAITTDENPHGNNLGNGITGSSDGWKEVSFDLSAYAGQKVEVGFKYKTDAAAILPGFYADDISIKADGEEIVFDDAESESNFELNGFTKSNGIKMSEHYYLLEWRSHNGVDRGLANLRRGGSLMEYDPGLVVWYIDNKYTENWTGFHPGEGFLGVVDADQKAIYWSDGTVASTRYQVHDAAFTLEKKDKMFIDYSELLGRTMKDYHTKRTPLFDDSENYLNEGLVDAGRNVPEYGLNFRVAGQSKDGTVGKVLIYK